VATKFSYTNSDNAWYAMVGRGIAEGNIMLKGWVGSTMSHYFPYGLMEAFWSLFIHRYDDAHALSIVSLSILLFAAMWLTLKILLGKNPRMFSMLTLAPIVIAMEPSMLADSFAHIAPLIPTLFIVCLYYGDQRDRKWTNCLTTFLIACWSDAYCFVYFFIPLVLENILFFLKTKKIDSRLGWMVSGVTIYISRSIILKKLRIGIFVPGIKAHLRAAKKLATFKNIGRKIVATYWGLMRLFSANFLGNTATRVLPNLCFALLLLISLWLHYNYSREICKKKFPEERRFMVFLLISSLSIFGLLIFSTLLNHERYLVGPFLNSLIILGYWLNIKFDSDGKLAAISTITLLSSLLVQLNAGRYRMDQRLIDRRKMAAVIHQENLHGGYAWFDNAQSMNFILNEQKIATICDCPGTLCLWLVNKRTFCQNKFDFVLSLTDVRNGSMGWEDWECENGNDVLKQFGIPKKTVDVGNVRLYIYDDITGVVKSAGLCDDISKKEY
jgi:hypothetical protein